MFVSISLPLNDIFNEAKLQPGNSAIFRSPPFKNKPCDSSDLNFESNLAYFGFNLSIFDYFETKINKKCSEMA